MARETSETVVLLLTGSVCVILLITTAGMAWHGPDVVKDEGREALQSLVALVVGILSGYVLRDRKS